MTNHFENIIQLLSTFDSFKLIHKYCLENNDVDIYIAGGIIRNYFIDKNLDIKDIDLFFNGNINPLLEILKRNGELNLGPFGSLRWFPNNDLIYFDIISIESFNNGVEKCYTINDVLNQFDFTANCLAFRLSDGSFFNPCNGLNAIKEKTIKMVRYDYPDEKLSKEINISRTAILWFRLLHYATKLDFKIEQDTKKWLIDNQGYYTDLDIFKKYFFNPKIDKNILHQI